MPVVIFDTETTGFVLEYYPASHPDQPHLVQLAALLADDDGTERASMCVLIRPEGWTIPAQATAVHHISTATAERYGVSLRKAAAMFADFLRVADTMVAHNLAYDDAVMEAAYARLGARPPVEPAKKVCTKEWAAPIVNLPPTVKMIRAGFGGKPKAPTLAECMRHFFGAEPTAAHDALGDARDCARVYFHLKAMEAAAA